MSEQSADVIERVWCAIFGHDWVYIPDGETPNRLNFECARCTKLGHFPGKSGPTASVIPGLDIEEHLPEESDSERSVHTETEQ